MISIKKKKRLLLKKRKIISNNILLLISLIVFFVGCNHRKPSLLYYGQKHILCDKSNNKIRAVKIVSYSELGIVSCEKNIYTKNSGATSCINLELPDSLYFYIHDNLNCKFLKGENYYVIVDFLGYTDSTFITW
jgi:hypothetical protein